MKVTLDTNIIVQDFWFKNLNSELFCNELHRVPAILYISEIVIDETVNKFNEKLNELNDKYQKEQHEISKFLQQDLKFPQINTYKETEEYKIFLLSKLKSINCQIIPYPEVSHKEVVERIFNKKKPFHKDEKGYRDFLIWTSILKLKSYPKNELVFITNNESDFEDEEDWGEGMTIPHYLPIKSISSFNEKYIIPKLPKLEQTKIKLKQEKFLEKWLEANLLKNIQDLEINDIILGGIGNVNICDIYNEHFTAIIEELNELEEERKILKFSTTFKAWLHIQLSGNDYLYIINKPVFKKYGLNRFDYPLDWASMTTTEDIQLTGYLTLDKNNEVINQEIILISVIEK